jgi:hypothetical protein
MAKLSIYGLKRSQARHQPSSGACLVSSYSDTDRKNLFEIMDNGDIYILFKGKYRRLQTLLDDNVFTIISDSK